MVASRRWRRVAVCSITVLFMCLALGAHAPRAHAAATGAVAAITWGESRADVDREIAMLRDVGAHYVRTNVNWAGLEPDRKGTLSSGGLAMYDYAVEQATAAGLEIVMPVSDGVPYWASGDPAKYVDASGGRHWDRSYPPTSFADYADVYQTVVERYAPRGVHIYEIWNEPNLSWFWSSGPDPAQYARMLTATYPRIKAADPQSTVLLGGLSKNDFAFLEGVYRAGGGGSFDAVAVHPYTYGVDPAVSWNGVNPGEDRSRLSWNCFPALQEIHKTMVAHGDSAKSVWVTEFGWSTTSADGGVSPAQQAAFLTKAYTYVEQFPWVKAMLWYSARNTPWRADADDYGSQFGLVTTGWQAKPSAAALRDYSARSTPATPPASSPASSPTPTPTPTPSPTPVASPPAPATPPPPPGPVNAAPAVALVRPVAGARFTTSLDLAATASDDTGVNRVEFRVDGRTVATDRTAPYATRWRPAKDVATGTHRVSAVAYDAAGLSTTATVEVTRATTAGTRTAPSVVSLRSATAGRASMLVRGRLLGRGAVRVELQRRTTGGWQRTAAARAQVSGRTYRALVRASTGSWRVRAVDARRSTRRWSSPYRVFHIAAGRATVAR